MPDFVYETLNANGQSRSGLMTALNRADAVRQLSARGETPTKLHEADAKGKSKKGAAAPASRTRPARAAKSRSTIVKSRASAKTSAGRRPSLSRIDLANLIRELATALEAGLPLMQSLKTVRRQAPGRAMPVILDHLIERVESGDPLYVAARDYGPPFDDMVLGMLRAADASGNVSEIMHQLADLLERSVELRRDVTGALIYPMVIGALIGVSIIVLVTVLVPRLIAPLADQITLPLPTVVVLGFADFMSSWWWLMLGIAIAGWLSWRAWSKIPANRLLIDRTLLNTPVLGRLLRDIAVARFTRTLGTLTTSGMPILEALRITRNTLANQALMSAIDEVSDQVTSGKALADPLERSGLFPPLLVQVVNLGERSGRLETMLLHAANSFDRQVNASLKIFMKVLPIILLITMALLGSFVLSAILLPLLELQSLVG
ncbi:MAG: type II secretion system F family protein [Phycisphaerales bacterium]|nr:type II secretion system F family protein [Phycisphaerales bacterium]